MNAKAITEARHAELVRAFLMDLEHEYSRAHRIAFQAHWGIDALPRTPEQVARELDLTAGEVAWMIDQGLVYARKWFGADGVARAMGARELKEAA